MSSALVGKQGLSRTRKSVGGFTLIEILTATALLVLISLFLASMASQSARLWNRGESQTQHRQRARIALSFMARELQQALLSPDAANGALQFVVNPSAVTTFPNRDTVFWQAPIATDSSRGDLAEVGYFVRWTGTKANLCRFFINPSDSANYHLFDAPAPARWVSDSILQAISPGDKTSHYQGLFLENAIGMWVRALQADGTAYVGDSRVAGRLPAFVQISLAFLDRATAGRVSVAQVSTIQALYGSSGTAEAFVASLPTALRAGASTATISVNLDNYK